MERFLDIKQYFPRLELFLTDIVILSEKSEKALYENLEDENRMEVTLEVAQRSTQGLQFWNASHDIFVATLLAEQDKR